MSSTENPDREPVQETTAPDTPTTNAEHSEQSVATPTPASPKHARIAESKLEAAHADLPPLSNIPSGNNAAAETSTTGLNNNRTPAGRRGLGRGPTNSRTSNAAPAIGAVEDPANVSETLSGQYASGYGERPERQERRERPEYAPRPTPQEAPGNSQVNVDGPREFIPPVSQETYKAEMNPERERQAREDRRRERETRDGGTSEQPERFKRSERAERPERPQRTGTSERSGERSDRQQNRREYFGERREDKGGEWAPKRSGSAPQKLIIEPAKMPVQPDDSFLGKIKRFFSTLFGGAEKTASKSDRKPHSPDNKNRGDRGGYKRGSGSGRHQNYRDRQRGDFRHGNQGDSKTPRSYNRDGRHRPHARGGNHRSGSHEG